MFDKIFIVPIQESYILNTCLLYTSVVPSCDTLIENLSNFFIVSRVSVKYRLIEVGLLDKLRDFNDFDAVFAEITESKELVALTPLEAYQLLAEDSSLREWVRGGKFVYADGYFVLAEKQYVLIDEGELHLTAKAKKKRAQCAINIREHKYTAYRNVSKDLLGFSVLHRVEAVSYTHLLFIKLTVVCIHCSVMDAKV